MKKEKEALACARKKTSIGGQALIEGIMMRGPQKSFMAVRNTKGEIVVEELEITDYEISIKTDIDSDDSIVISSIDVTVSESCSERAQELSARLLEDVDCQVNVYVGGL